MKECAIFLCDLTGNMAKPWEDEGVTCICVDIQHSIRATRKNGYAKVRQGYMGGMTYFVYGDARSWKPTDFDRNFFQKYRIIFVGCFPVCTNVAGSGAQDWQLKGLAMLCDGLTLFNACETVAAWSGAPYCVENPAGAITRHHRPPDYTFQPWFYGDLWQKKTCLWTGNGFVMPEADYIIKPKGVTQKIWLASPGPNRQNERSETPEGFTRAVKECNYKRLEEVSIHQ
jgi:hypothetical protein